MANLIVVVGESRAAVIATADQLRIQINKNAIKEFDSLATTYSPQYPDSGRIDARQHGFVVIGVLT